MPSGSATAVKVTEAAERTAVKFRVQVPPAARPGTSLCLAPPSRSSTANGPASPAPAFRTTTVKVRVSPTRGELGV